MQDRLATIRIKATVHKQAKTKAKQDGMVLSRLTEKLLAAWSAGQLFFAPDGAVRPNGDGR